MAYSKRDNLDLLYNLSKLYEEELTGNLKLKENLNKKDFYCRRLQEKIIISSNVLKSIDEIKYHVEIGAYDNFDLVTLLIDKAEYHLNSIKKIRNEK